MADGTPTDARRVGRGRCAICGEYKNELVEFRGALGEPVCGNCVPTAQAAIQESNRGLIEVISAGIGYLLGMGVYLIITLGVSLYLVGAFDLVWWAFFLISGIALLGGAHFSEVFDPREIVDLAYATILMSITIWVALGGSNFQLATLFGGVAILGLIFHELSHKAIGLGFGKPAQFSTFYTLNLVSLALAYFTGFLLLLPGAVKHQSVTERVIGIIAAAGPVSNIALATVFLGLGSIAPEIARAGVIVNTGLAGFNMLPISPLDGSHVWKWNRPAYLLISGVILFYIAQLIIVFG